MNLDINCASPTSPWGTSKDNPSSLDNLRQTVDSDTWLVSIETKNIKTIALKERDPIVDPVYLCIMPCASQGGRVLLDCVDTFVATQGKCDGVATDSCEAVQYDELVAWFCCGNVLGNFTFLC